MGAQVVNWGIVSVLGVVTIMGGAKGTGNPMADLHFTYRDGPSRLCCELDGLKEDEITVVLEALKQRFDTVEQGAFSFSTKQEEGYSPLEWAKRQRNGG